MTEPPSPHHVPLDELVSTLLPLPEEGRKSVIAACGAEPATIVRALKDRTFALLTRDPVQALRLAEVGVTVATMTDDHETQALATRGLAQALHASGRYAAAVERYDAAHAAFTRRGDASEAARTLIGKVDALMYLGSYDEAIETARSARAVFEAQGEAQRVARIETNLGNIYHRLDRPVEALEAYERARRILTRGGHELDVAIVDHNRGNVLAMLNRFDAALDAYAAAKATYSAHGSDADYACTAYNEAYLHFLCGHYGRALVELAQVRARFTQLGDRRHLALCDLDEAEVLLALNRRDEAGVLAGRAADSFDGLAMRYEAAKARAFQAIATYESGDLTTATALLADAEARFQQEGNRVWVATVRLLMADIDLQQGKAASALERCTDALALLGTGACTPRIGRGRVLRGQALRGLGRREEATAEAKAAKAAAATLGDRVLSYQASHLLGRLQEEAGDLEGAASSYLQAADDVDWLRGGISRDDLRISFAGDKVALYEDIVRNFLRRERVADAFAQVERAKARALVDLLAGGPTIRLRTNDADATLAARVDRLRAELSGLYNRLHGEDEERQRVTAGSDELLALMRQREDEISAALATLQVRQAEYVSLRSVSTAGLDQVRQQLGRGDALLEYYVLGDDVITFLVTDTDARVYGPLASGAEVEGLVQEWRSHLARFRYGPAFVRRHGATLYSAALAILGELYARLIAPLAPDLAGRDLVVVPHGALHHVPFHALYDGRSFLIQHHEISYAPSATVLALQRAKEVKVGGTLIVGLPGPALSHVAEEVAAVAACYTDPRVLLGASATRARFSACAGQYSHLHLATHAVFRADNPLFSAVQLADDWLTVSDIYDLDLAADLVVLSACETGASEVLRGDELIGLTRGFMYAGARSLVVSLWAANDAATAALMERFYQSVAAGASARGALRTAQCEAMERVAHPYYWAPFIAFGPVSTRG
ncbi:MAG TPA: CHAT domain-containing tetratricopeptide repeat protein [Chloroflexota bacterium]|nr:CHAT domain-containing tetratricopeptide repeat protein [Chloroflexota bacterium]